MSSERPAKRIRQACEPCRRKKSKCPGEKPVCSHCSRLRQECFYADDRHEIGRPLGSLSPTPLPRGSGSAFGTGRVEDRLRLVESQLAEILANQAAFSRSASCQLAESPTNQPQPSNVRSPLDYDIVLPSWDIIINAAETYLLYLDCQPLPLFHRSTFLQTIRNRDPEVIFSLLAVTSRFTGDHPLVHNYVEAARRLIAKRLDGSVELSTIQALCLLTIVDFTDGHTRRASFNCSQAMSLAHNARLTTEPNVPLSRQHLEEHRRCFWSLFLLKRLHGADFMVLDFSADDGFPFYPETTSSPHSSPEDIVRSSSSDLEPSVDRGMIAYAIQQSEIWYKITRYAWRRGKPSTLPPWSSQSEYSTILAQLSELETRMPYKYRFRPAKFSQQPVELLNAHRDYWGPWLFVQFVYHTNLCLLNHPLLLSLRLRGFKCVIPEIFLQHTSDLISSHTSWIINFIDMLEAKQFKVTDPFLGHCVAIVATIYLQESFVDDSVKREEKKACFDKCLGFIRGFGVFWPHVNRIADKLQKLSETVSSTHVASEVLTRQNRKLLIDLGQFFEILEYSSVSELSSSGSLFGPSLRRGFATSRREIAQTSVLPEPNRVEGQEFGSPARRQENHDRTPSLGVGDAAAYGIPNYSDDELAVLAENFFQQRHGMDGSVNWWNAEDYGPN